MKEILEGASCAATTVISESNKQTQAVTSTGTNDETEEGLGGIKLLIHGPLNVAWLLGGGWQLLNFPNFFFKILQFRPPPWSMYESVLWLPCPLSLSVS